MLFTAEAQTPQRSADQVKAALAKANTVRLARADYKRAIQAGQERPMDVLADPPEWAARWHVMDLLRAIPGVGPCKARKWLRHCGVADSKTIGGLTERQRRQLVVLLWEQWS